MKMIPFCSCEKASQAPPFVEASAPGKTIVVGEHAVMYGKPALGVAINKRTHVRIDSMSSSGLGLYSFHSGSVEFTAHWNAPAHKLACVLSSIGVFLYPAIISSSALSIKVHGDLPQGSGLGSSASLCVSLAGALSVFLLGRRSCDYCLFHAAMQGETILHTTSSGLDSYTALFGGVVTASTQSNSDKYFCFQRSPKSFGIRNLFLLDSGQRKSGTDALVKHTASLKHSDPTRFSLYIDKLATLAREFIGGDAADPTLLDQCHLLLIQLGVSTARIDEICEHVRSVHKMNAKLTGAGGGGFVLALPSASALDPPNAMCCGVDQILCVSIDPKGLVFY